jgi:hypothetical protein
LLNSVHAFHAQYLLSPLLIDSVHEQAPAAQTMGRTCHTHRVSGARDRIHSYQKTERLAAWLVRFPTHRTGEVRMSKGTSRSAIPAGIAAPAVAVPALAQAASSELLELEKELIEAQAHYKAIEPAWNQSDSAMVEWRKANPKPSFGRMSVGAIRLLAEIIEAAKARCRGIRRRFCLPCARTTLTWSRKLRSVALSWMLMRSGARGNVPPRRLVGTTNPMSEVNGDVAEISNSSSQKGLG